MSYKQEDKKPVFKPKYEQKNKVRSKFNFVFDEQRVNFKTEIPQLPTKPRAKPDQKGYEKKVTQLKQKIDNLKDQRKKMKQSISKGSKNFDQEIKQLRSHVDLGKKCLIVLKHDLEDINNNLQEIQDKISRKTKKVKNLQRAPRQPKNEKKTYEQMNYQQLQKQQTRLTNRMTLSNLQKKQQTEINNLIAKIARLKINAPHGEKLKDNTQDIENTQQSISRLRHVKQNLQQEEVDVKSKIQAIQDDIDEFYDKINQLQQQKKNPQNQALYEDSQKKKNQIYQLRDQLAKFQKEFENKKAQYDYQQAKIQWIKWATQVQNKKNQQWQAGREERRKQKLREKNKQKNGQNKDGQGKQAVQGLQQKKPLRPKFNKHQKQIDNYTFLVQYCNGLINKQSEQAQEKQAKREENKNIESALKTGQWQKMKDVQIVKSKKSNLDDQLPEKNKKKKQQKNKQGNAANQDGKPVSFNHNIFVQQLFDTAKIVPPTKPQQVQQIVKQLNTKLEYFLSNPEGGPSDKQKQKYVPQKYEKAKNNPRDKKVVNTEDFPRLS